MKEDTNTTPTLYNQYGELIVYLHQSKLICAVPNRGQLMPCFNEQGFYEYELLTENKRCTGIRMILDVEAASRFARLNGFKILK